MSKEVPAIFMQDPKTGENVYVVSHVDYVDDIAGTSLLID